MTLKGEMRVNRDGKTVAIPISASAHHGFVERVLEIKDKGLPEKVAREYSLAKSAITVESGARTQALSEDRRLIVAQRHGDERLCYSPAGPMTGDDLELVGEQFDTLALTGILPAKAVEVGESWKLSNEAVQSLCQFVR